MIVKFHKPAQIDIWLESTIYITTYNGADLFKIFNLPCNCDHDFHGIIQS